MQASKIIHIITFLVVVLTIFAITSELLDPVRLGLTDQVAERDIYMTELLAEQENTVDVVVVGDSESYTFLSPLTLWEKNGINVYLGGQSGQKLVETYYGLKDILKKQSPKLIILETNVCFNELSKFAEARCIADELVYYYFPVFKYHGIWRGIAGDRHDVPVNYNGFQIRNTVAAYTGGAYMSDTAEKRPISSVNRYYMNKIVKLCEENDIKLMLVSSPSPLNYNMQIHNALSAYASEHNIDYLDMNLITDDIGINWETDTLDAGDHLNLSGALKVSEYMSTYLDANYDLPDHRNDAGYNYMNKRMEAFLKEILIF